MSQMNSLMGRMQLPQQGMVPGALANLQRRMGLQAQPRQEAVDPRFIQQAQAQQQGMGGDIQLRGPSSLQGHMGVPPPRQLLQQNLMQNAAQQGGMRDMNSLMQRMKSMGGPVQPSMQQGRGPESLGGPAQPFPNRNSGVFR